MNIEALMLSIIGPLVGGRFYWDTTPQSGPPKDANGRYLPFCVGQLVGGRDSTYVDQTFPDYEHHRLQVISFAPSSLEATDLARQVKSSILANHKPADIVGSPRSMPDPVLLLKGRLQHFSIWIKP